MLETVHAIGDWTIRAASSAVDWIVSVRYLSVGLWRQSSYWHPVILSNLVKPCEPACSHDFPPVLIYDAVLDYLDEAAGSVS
jgi:hypothetical protein